MRGYAARARSWKKAFTTLYLRKNSQRAAQPWISHNLEAEIKPRDRLYKQSKKHEYQQVDDRLNALNPLIQKQMRKEHQRCVTKTITEKQGKENKPQKQEVPELYQMQKILKHRSGHPQSGRKAHHVPTLQC